MKKLAKLSVIFLMFVMLTLPVFAQTQEYNLVFDDANLLTDSQITVLDLKAWSLSEKHDTDIIICAVDDAGRHYVTAADAFVAEYDYGRGNEQDCLVLFVEMDDRNIYISTHGKVIKAFTDGVIDRVLDDVQPLFSNQNYYQGFDEFLNQADSMLSYYEEHGRAQGAKGMDTFMIILIAVGGSLALALIIVFILKAQLNTAVPKKTASDYLTNFDINYSRDIYLYSTVTKTELPKKSDNRSSTHRGSNGSSFGGGGRKF